MRVICLHIIVKQIDIDIEIDIFLLPALMILPASPISPKTDRQVHIRLTLQTHTCVGSRATNRGFTFGTRSSWASCNP